MKSTLHSLGRLILAVYTASVLLWGSGCANYKWGNPTELNFTSIYIQPTQSETFAPQAQAVVSSQIRKAFIQDGRVALVSDAKHADAVLAVRLIDYTRTGGARRSEDTIVAQNFNISLGAEISLYSADQSRVYISKRALNQSSIAHIGNPYSPDNSGGYLASEYDAMPRIARGIARKIVDEVLSPWPKHSD
jgi:hypothetical protein